MKKRIRRQTANFVGSTVTSTWIYQYRHPPQQNTELERKLLLTDWLPAGLPAWLLACHIQPDKYCLNKYISSTEMFQTSETSQRKIQFERIFVFLNSKVDIFLKLHVCNHNPANTNVCFAKTEWVQADKNLSKVYDYGLHFSFKRHKKQIILNSIWKYQFKNNIKSMSNEFVKLILLLAKFHFKVKEVWNGSQKLQINRACPKKLPVSN